MQALSSAACTAQNLYVRLSAAPNGLGKTRTFAIMDDASPTAVTCVVTNLETACNDTGNTAAVAAGSVISVREQAANSPEAADAYIGWECL